MVWLKAVVYQSQLKINLLLMYTLIKNEEMILLILPSPARRRSEALHGDLLSWRETHPGDGGRVLLGDGGGNGGGGVTWVSCYYDDNSLLTN